MKSFQLPTGETVLVDDEDYEQVMQHAWRRISGKGGVAVGTTIVSDGRRTTLLLHRFLLDAPVGMQVDHKAGDRFDNRRHMLRVVTPVFNQRAFRRKARGVTSRFRGVSRLRGKWRAFIGAARTIGNNNVYLGTFDREEDAARAYNAAVLKFGFPAEALNPV